TARRDGRTVVVSVRDTGIGIPSDMLPRVFDIFMQLDASQRRSQGGLGIGLTLVRNLVQLHQGSVTAFSDGPGKGSWFVVRLPLAEGPSADAAEPRTGAGIDVPSRILIADDNQDAANSLGTLLRFLGAEVHVVHDGPAALAALESFVPTLVLLDIGM